MPPPYTPWHTLRFHEPPEQTIQRLSERLCSNKALLEVYIRFIWRAECLLHSDPNIPYMPET